MSKFAARSFASNKGMATIMQNRIWFSLLFFSLFLINLMGCTTAPLVMPPQLEGIPGIYHRVEKGQTLWRISKLYGIGLDDILRINRISDTTSIEVGQLLFIPRRHQKLQTSDFNEDFIWPLKGRVIYSFGQVFNNLVNKGINIRTIKKQDVLAAQSGKVVFYSPNFREYGKTIIIDHGNGFSTVYARNSEVFVKVGDDVKKGTSIAKVGSNTMYEDAYLHFEIRKGHTAQNPYYYLPH